MFLYVKNLYDKKNVKNLFSKLSICINKFKINK